MLRRGQHYAGRNWTQAHRAWLKTLTWEHVAEQHVVEDYLLAIDQVQARLADLDTHLAELAATAPYAEPVAWLRCFRGIDTLTAMTIVAELHDFRRFVTPRALMAYLGLVPSEHSSGGQTSRGRITKTGNALVRRVLTEAAWHYQHRPGIGTMLKRRREVPRVRTGKVECHDFAVVIQNRRTGTPPDCGAVMLQHGCAVRPALERAAAERHLLRKPRRVMEY